MAGIAAEALAFGGADGGAADEAALRRLLTQEARQEAAQPREPGEPGGGAAAGGEVSSQALRARARWAAANAVALLREQQPAYEALCEVRGGRSEKSLAGGRRLGAACAGV